MFSHTTRFTLILFIVFFHLASCANIDHQLDSDPEVVNELKLADLLGKYEKEKKFNEMIKLLEKAKKEGIEAQDYIKVAYVLNEELYLYGTLIGDLHKEKMIVNELDQYLCKVSSSQSSKYTYLPQAAQAKFSSVYRATNYYYIEKFRNISLGQIRNNVDRRKQVIAKNIVETKQYREESIESGKAMKIAKKIEKSLALPLPERQSLMLGYRHAYAMLFAEPKTGLNDIKQILHKSNIFFHQDMDQNNFDEIFKELTNYLHPMQVVKVFQRAGQVSTGVNTDDAINYTKISIVALEKLRSYLKTENERINFFRRLEILYDRIVWLLIKDHPMVAFCHMEIAKSRVLVDILSESILTKKKNEKVKNGTYVLDKYKSALSDSEFQLAMLDDVQNDERSLGVIKKDMSKKQAIKDLLMQQEPELFSLVEMETLTYADIAQLFQPNEIYVSFYSSIEQEKTVVFELCNGRLQSRIINISKNELRDLVETIRNDIRLRKFSYNNQTLSFFNQLFNNLDTLRSKSIVYISPYAALHNFPFPIIRNEQTYLSDMPFAIIPGSLSFKYMRNKKPKDSDQLIAIGDPDIPSEVKSLYCQLDGAYDEVKQISKYYGENAIILMRKDATETFVKKLNTTRNPISVLHIASHGYFDEKKPMYSHLILSKDEENDGFLEANEILNIDLKNLKLVVLSACETGKGEIKSGDDILGLNRSFFVAGTSNIVSSLWKVDDKATSFFMEIFYKNYFKNNNISRSLVEAYRETRLMYPDPNRWSAFQVYGLGI